MYYLNKNYIIEKCNIIEQRNKALVLINLYTTTKIDLEVLTVDLFITFKEAKKEQIKRVKFKIDLLKKELATINNEINKLEKLI